MGSPLRIIQTRLGPGTAGGVIEESLQTVLSTIDFPAVLERTAALLLRHFCRSRVTVSRPLAEEPGYAEVILASADSESGAPEHGLRFELNGSAAGEAIKRRRPVIVDPIRRSGGCFREEARLHTLGYGSLVSFPLLAQGRVLGALDIAHPIQQGLLDGCYQTALQVSRILAIALHNSLMVQEIQRLNSLLGKENELLRERLRQFHDGRRYVAESPAMRQVLDRLGLVASSDTTVLIHGDTGTGKEGLARLVHDLSPRAAGPFVIVNLGALPETLIEAELFGHERGAFTGADRRKTGRFEQADGGTLFLDEVGDAPPSVQVRLLRVLQEREIQRIGGSGSRPVDVRVVAATNRNLQEMVASAAFRSDLYYRLNVFPLTLPPLRERPEDIRPLTRYFVERQASLMHRLPPGIPEATWRQLEAHDWPGNVRELENFLQRALILRPGDTLILNELPSGASQAVAPCDRTGCPPGRFDDEVRDLLERALEAADGRIYGPDGAASLLGLKPTTLQGKLRKYGLARRAQSPRTAIANANPDAHGRR